MAQVAPSYCSLLAQEQNFDPIGTAYSYDDLIVIELPLPWAYRIYESSHLPTDLVEFVMQEMKARDYRLRVLFIAPEAEYRQPGMVRVMYFRRPVGMATRYERDEFLLPNAEMPDLVRAMCVNPRNLAAWEAYRQDVEHVRDFMVCTHGAVDVVCAKFGYPSYKMLRDQYTSETVRIWRVSHFGGHVCAPTLLSFPDGRAWAFINGEHAPHLVLHDGEPRDLYGNYRGWALLSRPFAQVVEREVWMREGWMREGWAWLDCQVEVEVTSAHEPEYDEEKSQGGEVILRYQRPDGRRGEYWGRVELRRTLKLFPSTKSEEPYPYPQYQVVALEHRECASQLASQHAETNSALQLEGTFA